MKGNILFGTVFSAALAVSVAAQGTAGSQADQKSSTSKQVTVTGCLQNADTAGGTAGTSGTGTAGSAASGSQASGSARAQFMLTNAKLTSGGAGATSGTAGTGTGTGTAGSATATAANKFLLTGGNQQELKKYLNSEVEIRGTLQPRSGADRSGAGTGTATGTGTGTGSGTGTGTGSATGQSHSQADAQMLRVTSVKQTSPTCTGQ
jgi:hypothetical protein